MRQGKPPLPNASTHIRLIRRSAWVTTTQWRRTLPYWVGAILVGIAAVSFAALADAAAQLRTNVLSWDPRVMILVMPFGLGLATWLTRRFFRSAQGSGIPQTIATLNTEDFTLVGRILSLRVALAKIFMTVFGIAVGASIGREGPTVQIGAAIMHAFSRLTGTVNVTMRRGAILAGGAAGISAAFNTPLAGIVFAIEELTHSFEQRTSGTMLTSVIISGVTALALVGNYSYFGHTNVEVPVGTAWAAVLGCGIFGGIAGGCFSATLVQFSQGRPRFISAYAQARPIKFAMLCGLVLAVIGLISHGATYGTGYAQARAIIDGREHYPASFFLYKLSATIVSYWSGIPGGIFAPSLSVGAGIGGWISQFLPHTSAGAVVLLGVVGYFSAVVQAPLTATVIVMEMSDNQQVTLAFMATSFLAFGVSRVICKKSLYGALAERFMTSFSPSSPSNETATHPQDVAPASDEALPSPEEQSPPSH